MLLQDLQGRSRQLSENRSRGNIPIIAWEYERNIQLISQCYGVKFTLDLLQHKFPRMQINFSIQVTYSLLQVTCSLLQQVKFHYLQFKIPLM